MVRFFYKKVLAIKKRMCYNERKRTNENGRE